MVPPSPDKWRPPVALVVLAGLVVAAIAVGAEWHIRTLWGRERAKAEVLLSTVGDLKASQIALWRRERLADAGILAHLEAFAGRPGAEMAGSARLLRKWFDGQGSYDEVRVLDSGGGERLVVPAGRPPLSGPLRQAALEALAEGRPRFMDFAREADGIRLHLLVPILDERRPLGLVALRIDPSRTLYPFILRWPTPSASAETHLVRREGGDAVSLNDLRSRPGSALAMRVPLWDQGRPAAMAVQGKVGIFEAGDYKGHQVLADLRPVADSPWFLVSRMDVVEAMAVYHTGLRNTLLLAAASTLAVAAACAAHWRNRKANFFRERLVAESARSVSEHRFRHAVGEVPFPMLIFAEDGEMLMLSRAFTEISGYALADVPTLDLWAENAYGPRKDAVLAVVRGLFDQPRREDSREHVIQCRDGSTRRWDFSSVALDPLPDGRRVVMSMAHDITDRKEAEEVLRRSEERFALIFNASPDAIAITRLSDGEYLLVNERFVQVLGREVADVLGRSSLELGIWVDPQDRVRWAEALRAGGGVDNLETTLRRGDGTPVVCLLSSRAITWGVDLVQLSIFRDITVHRQLERALRESEAEYRLLFDRSLDAIVLSKPNGTILDANPAACELFGRTVEELRALGRDAVLDTTDARLALSLAERDRTGRWRGELTCLHRDGTRFCAELSSVLFTDKNGLPKSCVIVRDIRDRQQAEDLQRKLDAEIQQSQKLDSLGSLAGGVAHDMNNILGAIQAVIETLKLTHGEDGALLEGLGLVEKAAIRGRDLVMGLTKFSRKNLREPEVLDLNALVRDEMDLLSRTTLQKFRLVTDLQEPLAAVSGERGSLASALMNLCVNALDAMPEGGTLTLRTRNMAGGQVEIQVQDTGTGMPPEVAARAMDPFFTTKAIGKGTGLGLAMAYATAKSHSGTLAIHSEKDKGTTVSLRLPAWRGELPGPRAAEGSSEDSEPLRILLVDDDDLIRASVPNMLRARGHHVATAPGGAEGLARLDAGPPVDLVILDLNMPGMNGIETHGLIRRRWRTLPILLATGHLDTRTSELLEADGHILSIAKPYSMDELVGKLNDLRAMT